MNVNNEINPREKHENEKETKFALADFIYIFTRSILVSRISYYNIDNIVIYYSIYKFNDYNSIIREYIIKCIY